MSSSPSQNKSAENNARDGADNVEDSLKFSEDFFVGWKPEQIAKLKSFSIEKQEKVIAGLRKKRDERAKRESENQHSQKATDSSTNQSKNTITEIPNSSTSTSTKLLNQVREGSSPSLPTKNEIQNVANSKKHPWDQVGEYAAGVREAKESGGMLKPPEKTKELVQAAQQANKNMMHQMGITTVNTDILVPNQSNSSAVLHQKVLLNQKKNPNASKSVDAQAGGGKNLPSLRANQSADNKNRFDSTAPKQQGQKGLSSPSKKKAKMDTSSNLDNLNQPTSMEIENGGYTDTEASDDENYQNNIPTLNGPDPLDVLENKTLSLSSDATFNKGRYIRVQANIGEGAYGKVHKCEDLQAEENRKSPGDHSSNFYTPAGTSHGRYKKIEVAIKKIKVKSRSGTGIHLSALREIKLMQSVRHENVMVMRHLFIEEGVLHLVMGYMDVDLEAIIGRRYMWNVMQVLTVNK